MKVWRMVIKEILYRKLSFALGLAAVTAAMACLVGALTVLKIHDLQTRYILERKQVETRKVMAKLEDDIRKTMLKLGFNIVILPKDQNLGDWYAEDYGSKYMAEESVEKLARSKMVAVRHLLPSLQQKIKWPEKKRTVILIGTRGEVPNLYKNPKKPLVQPVPRGKMVVGYELHQSLGLKVGDTVTLLGREFTVHKCHEERGSKDDITVWIHLAEAQELLDKKGRISAILGLECKCAWTDVTKVRDEIKRILPDTQVVEIGSKALARADARTRVADEAKAALERERTLRSKLRDERERFASFLVVIVLSASAASVGFLAFANVRERRSEIGILRAMGFRSGQILFLFMSKAIIMGLLGGLVGFVLGFFAGKQTDIILNPSDAHAAAFGPLFDPKVIVLALILAPSLSAAASWIPAMSAARQDPAEILHEE